MSKNHDIWNCLHPVVNLIETTYAKGIKIEII